MLYIKIHQFYVKKSAYKKIAVSVQTDGRYTLASYWKSDLLKLSD